MARVVGGVVGGLTLVACAEVDGEISPPDPMDAAPSTTIEPEVSATVTVSPTATAPPSELEG
ncbi:MAG: hypothetical protein S0880_29225 [Actinomycetota bacterium]|nr:hypothetical protein [Actinomycetota bacterium]